jgi:C1A family cysteine protease
VLGVGYDDAAKRFTVRNSWGADWGMKGYFTIPYDYLDNRNLSDDFWTIRREEQF